MLREVLLVLTLFRLQGLCTSKIEGKIVHGLDAEIDQFPHSAYLAIYCYQTNLTETYGCGASIISQRFLLSAAHCLAGCIPEYSIIAVAVGSTTRAKANNKGLRFKCHPDYRDNDVDNDICIIRLRRPVRFSDRVKKALILKTTPDTKIAAVVSGWGKIDEELGTGTIKLQTATQRILSKQECIKVLKDMPENSFCTESIRGYAAEGDSGSGLMMFNFVQVGIVSCKNDEVSKSVVIFTNVTSFYDWIFSTMEQLSCE